MHALLLLSYVLLCFGMFYSYGLYHPLSLLALLLSFAVLLCAGWFRVRKRELSLGRFDRFVVPVCVLFLMGIQYIKPAAIYIGKSWYAPFFWSVLGGAIACVALAMFFPTEERQLRRVFLGIAVLLGATFYIALPAASPEPHIDTWVNQQESARHLLEGEPPYGTVVKDIYKNNEALGRPMGYVYLPGNLYPQTVSYLLTKEVRYVYVLSIFATTILLWWIARKFFEEATADFLPLLFLFHPRGVFVLEQGWIDPFVLFMFTLFAWLQVRQAKPHWASAAYGYFLSLKQTLVFFPIHWLMIERRPKQWLIAVGVGLFTAIPFLLTDFSHFWRNGVLHNLMLPFRQDSLTLAAWLKWEFNIEVPLWWNLALGAVLTAATMFLFRKQGFTGYLFAVTITTFALFLFGKQGFCNYYWFTSGLMMVLLVSATRSEESARV